VAERHRAAVRVDEQVWRDAIRGFEHADRAARLLDE
jgi:hypothetical protein